MRKVLKRLRFSALKKSEIKTAPCFIFVTILGDQNEWSMNFSLHVKHLKASLTYNEAIMKMKARYENHCVRYRNYGNV